MLQVEPMEPFRLSLKMSEKMRSDAGCMWGQVGHLGIHRYAPLFVSYLYLQYTIVFHVYIRPMALSGLSRLLNRW